MRKTALVLNSIVVIFFIGFLLYTFVAQQHLNSLARKFVTEKTLDHSEPIVDFADETLEVPLVNKFFTDDETTAIRNEITDYRNDPKSYIADLTKGQVRNAPLAKVNPLIKKANPLIEKVASIKNDIRLYYDETLKVLIADLRIVSISNLIAGLIALGLAYRSSSDIGRPIVWFSFLTFVAVLFCSYMYVDDLTFFNILFRSHMGWWYAPSLCFMTAILYVVYGRPMHAIDQPQ